MKWRAVGIAVITVLIVLIVLLSVYELWTGGPADHGGFTGVKVYAGSDVGWGGRYEIYTTTHGTGRFTSFYGSGNQERPIDCPQGHFMWIEVSAFADNWEGRVRVESWVHGQMSERNSGRFDVVVEAVC